MCEVGTMVFEMQAVSDRNKHGIFWCGIGTIPVISEMNSSTPISVIYFKGRVL